MLVSRITFFRVGLAATFLLGFFLLSEGVLRFGFSEKRLRERIARETGMTVAFERCSVGMWGGVSVRGLTAKSGTGDSLSADSVLVRPSLWNCFRGLLKFEEVRVNRLRFVRMEAVDQAARRVLVAGEVTGGTGAVGGAGTSEVLKYLALAKKVTLNDAALDWVESNGSIRNQLEGVGLRYEETAPGEGTMELHAQRGIWQEMVAVDAVDVRLRLRGEKLSIEECTAECGGGKLVGTGGLGFGEPVGFNLHLLVKGVDLERMSQGLPSLRLSGLANGLFDFKGLVHDHQTWVGGGELGIVDGMFKGLGVLHMLGQVFQVQELAQIRARKAHSKIRIADKKVWLENFQIDAGDIQLRAPGVVDFNRRLSMQVEVSLPGQMIRGKALQLFEKRFSRVDSEGRRSLAFEVTGTLEKPQTDLLDKLAGDNFGGVVGGALGGVVDQLLGGLLKPRRPAKAEAEGDGAEVALPRSQPRPQ